MVALVLHRTRIQIPILILILTRSLILILTRSLSRM